MIGADRVLVVGSDRECGEKLLERLNAIEKDGKVIVGIIPLRTEHVYSYGIGEGRAIPLPRGETERLYEVFWRFPDTEWKQVGGMR